MATLGAVLGRSWASFAWSVVIKSVRTRDSKTYQRCKNVNQGQGGVSMSEYVFLYRGGEAGRSPERIQQMMQKWMAWFKDLAEKGHVRNQGHPLERVGKLVKGSQKTVVDGPFVEAKDVIGGYSVIEARDLDQAVELSKGCPILENEGAVEVRPIMLLNL